jgi:hypothetical protein
MNQINRDHLTDLIVEMANSIAEHELKNENVEFLVRHQMVHGCKGLIEIPITELIKKYKETHVFESQLDDMEWNVLVVALERWIEDVEDDFKSAMYHPDDENYKFTKERLEIAKNVREKLA